MFDFFFQFIGVPPQALFGQLLLGLINGAFYALLSLGLAVIFGMLNVINFTHGAQYMMGAFGAWMMLEYVGIPYWGALVLVAIVIGATGIILERVYLSRLYHLDHLYGLLLTFGLALIMSLIGPVTLSGTGSAISDEFARRNTESLDGLKVP